MTKNQKIALGCGSAGCLGLIVLLVIGVVLFFTYGRTSSFSSNRSSNYNFNSNRSSDSNTSEKNSNSSTSSTSISDDEKHKLFQAVSMTKDTDLMHRVWKKLGLMGEDDTPNDEYATFVKDHVIWLFKNTDFIQSVNTEEKARAYVDQHIDD
jgi:hypothetical protein